jgi:hypothetical protein
VRAVDFRHEIVIAELVASVTASRLGFESDEVLVLAAGVRFPLVPMSRNAPDATPGPRRTRRMPSVPPITGRRRATTSRMAAARQAAARLKSRRRSR